MTSVSYTHLLLSTVYPTLRRTVFRMGFDVRPYTDDELEEMFITVPGCLKPGCYRRRIP